MIMLIMKIEFTADNRTTLGVKTCHQCVMHFTLAHLYTLRFSCLLQQPCIQEYWDRKNSVSAGQCMSIIMTEYNDAVFLSHVIDYAICSLSVNVGVCNLYF